MRNRSTAPRAVVGLTAVLSLFMMMVVAPAGAAPYVGPEFTKLGSDYTDWSGAMDIEAESGWEVDGGAVWTFWGDQWVEYQAFLTEGTWVIGVEAINQGDLGADPWAYPWFELSTNLTEEVVRVPASDTEVGHGWVYFEVEADDTYTVRFTWLNDWTEGENPDGTPILDANIRIETVFFDPVVPAEQLGWVHNPENGHWYTVIFDETFPGLEAQAAFFGGHLVTIDDQAEQDWLYDTFGATGLLIGFNDRAVEGAFEWTSGDPVTYTNWCAGEPNDANEGEDVVEWVRGSQCWNDVPEGGGLGLAEFEFPPNLYMEPDGFDDAVAGLGPATVVDFEDFDAGPVNNSINGRDPFPGNYYADRGFTFTNPNEHPLYVAPGGLFWNESNSLSVARFPFEDDEEPIVYGNEDDLGVVLDPTCAAVGFTLVDNGSNRPSEYIEFLDAEGAVITRTFLPGDYTAFRAFIGIVSPDNPVAAINIAEDAFDGDDVGYDDFVCYPGDIGVDLSVDKTDDIDAGFGPDPVGTNGLVAYGVLVANVGDEAATEVSFTDTPSNGTVFDALGDGWTCSVAEDGSYATCDLDGELGPDGAAAPPVTVLVSAPSVAGTIVNEVTVSSAEEDANPEDNTDTESTTVAPNAGGGAVIIPAGGGTFSTGEDPSPDDPVVVTVDFGAGDNDVLAIVAEVGEDPFRTAGVTNGAYVGGLFYLVVDGGDRMLDIHVQCHPSLCPVLVDDNGKYDEAADLAVTVYKLDPFGGEPEDLPACPKKGEKINCVKKIKRTGNPAKFKGSQILDWQVLVPADDPKLGGFR